MNKTVLDTTFEEQQAAINKNFLKEWKSYEKLNEQVETAILRHFMRKPYNFQPTHDKTDLKPFRPVAFNQIDELLGLAYTSSSDFAGLWVCNSGYLLADSAHHFIGFAINELNQVVGIADDENENSIYIIL